MNANPVAAPIANLASLPAGKEALHAKLASFPLAILRRLVQELEANSINPLSDASVRQSFYQPSTPASTRADILLPAVEYWQQRGGVAPAAPPPPPPVVQAMAPVPSPAPVAPAPAPEAAKTTRRKDPRPAQEAAPAAVNGAVVSASDVIAALQSRIDALPTTDVTNVLAGKINVLLSNQEKIVAQLEAAHEMNRKILGLVAVLSQGAFVSDVGEHTFTSEVEPLLKQLEGFTSGK